MPRVLIVAYGNPLRSDDGVAWRAADALEAHLPESAVEIVRVHQLVPELAEAVSRSAAVIFVDAAQSLGNPGEVRCEELVPTAGDASFSHQMSPAGVVALAKQLYDASPRAFSATLTGECFDHGEALSSVAASALPALVARIEKLVQQFLSGAS